MQVVYISKEQILFQESKIAKVIWIFDVCRFLLSEFLCAKLKTKFGNKIIISKNLLGANFLIYTNKFVESWRRALHVGNFSIYGKSPYSKPNKSEIVGWKVLNQP
jgi:hypothetical protein